MPNGFCVPHLPQNVTLRFAGEMRTRTHLKGHGPEADRGHSPEALPRQQSDKELFPLRQLFHSS